MKIKFFQLILDSKQLYVHYQVSKVDFVQIACCDLAFSGRPIYPMIKKKVFQMIFDSKQLLSSLPSLKIDSFRDRKLM